MSFTLKNVMLSFPQLFVPHAFEPGQTPKYGTQVRIPKGSEQERQVVSAYNEVLNEAVAAKKITKAKATPLIRPLGAGAKGILIDCDLDPETYPPEMFANCYVMGAKCKDRPVVINRSHSPLVEEDGEIYGGCIADVNVNVYLFKAAGGGIAVGLNGVMKTGDGEHLGNGRPSVDDMFGAAEEPGDDLYD